jgi:hypothetical protein
MKRAILGILLMMPAVAHAAPPVVFTADSTDGPIPTDAQDWLINSYIPSRWEAERQVIQWLNGLPAPDGRGIVVHVHIHPTLFQGFDGAGIVAGQMESPGFSLDYQVHVAWDYEMQRGNIVLSHEFGHLLQLLSGCAGWWYIGHGVPEDPILQKLLVIGAQVYMPGHVYDPFKPEVY